MEEQSPYWQWMPDLYSHFNQGTPQIFKNNFSQSYKVSPRYFPDQRLDNDRSSIGNVQDTLLLLTAEILEFPCHGANYSPSLLLTHKHK